MLRRLKRLPTFFPKMHEAAPFIARRDLFSVTRVALPCRSGMEIEVDRDVWNELIRDKRELEKSLCVARSVMAKTYVFLKEAERTQKLKIPVALSNEIAAEMKEQRKHRLEDRQSEIENAERELKSISCQITETHRESQSKESRKAELEKLLHELKAVDTESDAFLDRDATVHDSRKP